MKYNHANSSKKTGLPPGTIVYTGNKKNKKLFIEVFDYNNESFQEKN